MHNYGILKREGISIDNSLIKGDGINPYDKEFINSVAKYSSGVVMPVPRGNYFIDGLNYTVKKNKFVPYETSNRNPKVLLTANMSKSFLPRYNVNKVGFDYKIKTYDTVVGEELCIIHENYLNVLDYGEFTITRSFALDNNMMATYVLLKQNNQTITLSESL